MEYSITVFKGVQEINGNFLVIGNTGVFSSDGLDIPMFTAFYDQDGNYLESSIFQLDSGRYSLMSNIGLSDINSSLGYTGSGIVKSYIGESDKGFVAGFNEQGDTLAVLEFDSDDSGIAFNFPLDICNSTNEDHSIFISYNMFTQPTATDCYIQRMTPEGETLWQYVYATSANPDRCNAMLPTENGGVLAAVLNNNEGTKLIKLDSSGNEISFFESDVLQGFKSMKYSMDGNLIATSIIQGIESGWRPRISKVTEQGELIWSEVFGTNSPNIFINQEFNKLVHTQDDMYVAGGVHYEYVENPTDTSGTYNENGWLVKIDDDGAVQWERKYHFIDSPQDKHKLNDLKATSDGGYIFCGESRDEDPDQEFTTGPPQQGWLVKVDEYGCLVEDCQLSDGINVIEQEATIEYFKAGPIPAGQFLNIYQSQNAVHGSVYEFMDLNGRVLETFPSMSKGTTLMFDVSRFEVGSYVLSLIVGNRVLQSEKIIKE